MAPSQFSDPRKQQIYEELKEVVGPGPAAFFRDACWLMANPDVLDSTAHLIAHLLRELESAIRAVFKPVVEGALPKQKNADSHKKQIEKILAALNIEKESPEAKAWFELANQLHSLAHRRGLDAPRPTKDVQSLWDQAQKLLDVLVSALRERFLSWISVLDELLKHQQPTKDDLNRLALEVPNNRVIRQYFFDRLENPEWLEPLWKKGFFKHLPEPIHDKEEGMVRFPPWPETKYLARMAKHKPELIAQIIQEMDDTQNVSVLSDLVDALLVLPPDVSVDFVEKVNRWAESSYLLLPEKLGQLFAHWAKEGRTDEALSLAQVLLDILPDEHRISPGPDDAYRLPPEPRAHFDIWEYEQILKEHYPVLVRQTGLPALELLCGLLEKAIRLSRRHSDGEGPEDYSSIWHPAVEDHPQSPGHTIKDALVSAVRDASEFVVRSNKATVEEVVNALESRHWKVFRRIALHILRVFPDQGETLVAARLTDRSLFEDVGLQHEYVLLLRACFPNLTLKDQAKILGWVEDGPDVDEWKQWRESEASKVPSEEEVVRYREVWQRDWLARIGFGGLPTEWRERYRMLIAKYSEPEHPEFPVYTENGWVGPRSPKSADDLKAMSLTEIVKFLRAWKPLEDILRDLSPEGLGRELSSVVAEDPGRFATKSPSFKGLDPTYVRALVSGFREALKQNRTFDRDWKPVLELCQWVVSQPREIQGRQVQEMDADPNWGWTRKEIARLLAEGFQDRPGGIPISFRQKVWDILKPLTDDPEPTPDYEQRYGGSNMDPATLSINTTRGQAMHAVIRYTLWLRRHLEQESDAEERLAKGFDEMPEVREVLETHLNPNRDPSLAIRAVYGWRFPWLVLLDPNWARNHAAKILPRDQESGAFFEAAWNTYITFCKPYDNVLEILKPFYSLVVERIGVRRDGTRWRTDPDKKLAEHLMVFYWRGRLLLDDPLSACFWEKASDAVRAHALAFVGQSLKQTEGDISAAILDRLKKLWEQRLAVAKGAQQPSDFHEELAAFGWWFVSGKFDREWSLTHLLASLRLVHKAEPTHMVLEHLTKTAETHPLLSINCLKLIAEGDQDGWELYGSREDIRMIIQKGGIDSNSRDDAKRLIHYLGSRGFLEFRDLLNSVNPAGKGPEE